MAAVCGVVFESWVRYGSPVLVRPTTLPGISVWGTNISSASAPCSSFLAENRQGRKALGAMGLGFRRPGDIFALPWVSHWG